MEPKIALIGFSDLEAAGLKSFFPDFWKGSTESYALYSEFKLTSDTYVAYVVTSDAFVAGIDFFMPKRHKTIVVTFGNYDKKNRLDNNELTLSIDSSRTDFSEIISKLLDTLGENDIEKADLSSREIEVLKLLAAGKITKEIADILSISVNTAITHRKNISAKLGIKSLQGLSLYAMMNGLI